MITSSGALSRALLGALLLVAACSSSSSSDGSTRASPPPGIDVEVPADPGPDLDPAPTTTTVAPSPPASSSTAATRPSPTGSPRNEVDEGSLDVGQLAPFLLRPGNGDRIVVEVRAQQGAEPTRSAIDHVTRELAAASGKAVTVDGPERVAGAGQAWTPTSITALADGSADVSQGGDQIVLRLLFLRGSFDGNGSVLGASVRRDVAAIFTDQVSASGGLFANPAQILEATTVHEVGHLMGLVDLVLGAGRGDPDHPGHSRNRSSVMYWAVESSSIAQILGARIPTELDDDDRAELAAIRSG